MRVGIVIDDGSGSIAVYGCDHRKLPLKTTLVPPGQTVANLAFDYIFFIGFLPQTTAQTLSAEVMLKSRDLSDYVRMNFVQDLPVDSETVWWQYRVLPAENKEVPTQIRAAAINKDEYSKITEILVANDIKIDDCILAPLLLTEDIFAGISDYDECDIDSFMDYVSDHCESDFIAFISNLESDGILSKQQKLTLYAAKCYLEKSKKLNQIFSCTGMVTPELLPVRCQMLARANFVALIITAVLCLTALIMHFKQSYARYSQIENENRKLSMELRSLQKQNMQANQQRQLLKRYIDQRIGVQNFEFVLHELTQRIPSYMWVTSLRFSNQIIDLSVLSAKDDSNFYTTMNGGRLYILKNLSKKKSNSKILDGIEYSVKIELK